MKSNNPTLKGGQQDTPQNAVPTRMHTKSHKNAVPGTLVIAPLEVSRT